MNFLRGSKRNFDQPGANRKKKITQEHNEKIRTQCNEVKEYGYWK